MIRIAYCDDDLTILNDLGVLLDKYRVERNRDILYTAFHSPLELIAEIERGSRYDILILDVVMPGMDGISTAQEIRQFDTNVKIIFLTSSSEFAVQSYTVNAFFYQMKPIWKESFDRLMDSVISECKSEEKNGLILRCKSGITRIELDKLEYCEVSGRTLRFHVVGGTVYESNGSLDELSEQLAQYNCFVRAHRSFLVHMEYIQNISHNAITMMSGVQIPVPHGKSSEIKNSYLEYAFSRKQVFLS